MKSTKRIFNVASYNRNEQLVKMLESIYEQADIINVVINRDSDLDSFKKAYYFKDRLVERFSPKIKVFVLRNEILGDSAKFCFLHESDGYFFTVDDDLVYPPDYAEKMIEAYERYKGKSIVALHGRNFRSWPIESYYNSPFKVYRALGKVDMDVEVEFAGTCTTMWHTQLLQFRTDLFQFRNMGDIYLTIYANMCEIPIHVIAHNEGWLKYLLDKEDKTIFKDYKNSHAEQTYMANFAYGQTE